MAISVDLPRAVLPEQAVDLAPLDGEVHSVVGGDTARKRLRDVDELDERRLAPVARPHGHRNARFARHEPAGLSPILIWPPLSEISEVPIFNSQLPTFMTISPSLIVIAGPPL